jgi:hypothetical protein
MTFWRRLTSQQTLLLLIFIIFCVRLILFVSLKPSTFADSGEYIAMGHMLASGNFQHYAGTRTPGFPILLTAAQGNLRTIFFLQQLMGIGTAVSAYILLFGLTKRRDLAFIAGLLSGIHTDLVLYEAIIGTETLSTFLVTTYAALFIHTLNPTSPPKQRYVLGCWQVVIIVWMILTRPVLAIVPLSAALALLLRRFFKPAMGIVAVCALVILGWSATNYRLSGFFGLTTWQGYNLSRQTVQWVEKASPQYAQTRDILLKYRNLAVQGDMLPIEAPALATQEIEQTEHLNFIGVTKLYTKISIDLIIHHPLDYLHSIATKSWPEFWVTGTMLNPILVPGISPILVQFFTITRLPVNVLDALISLVFFLVTIAVSVRLLYKNRTFADQAIGIVSLFVLASSLAQAMLEIGNNARYSAPFRPLIMVVTVYGVVLFNKNYKRQ